jgi:hypothetical protein
VLIFLFLKAGFSIQNIALGLFSLCLHVTMKYMINKHKFSGTKILFNYPNENKTASLEEE